MRGAFGGSETRAVPSPVEQQGDIDATTLTADGELSDWLTSVQAAEIARGEACILAHGWRRDRSWDIWRRTRGRGGRRDAQELRDICIGDDGRSRLGGGLAGSMLAAGREDLLLRDPKAADHDRGDRDEQDRDHDGLAAIPTFNSASQGVHSMRRTELALTTILGNPTKPSGTGTS